MKGRSFLKLLDFTKEEILNLLDLSAQLKVEKKQGNEVARLVGKNIVLIFDKASTRTRAAFEVAAFDQGANVTYSGPTSAALGHREAIKDTARVLGRIYDAIQYRGFGQKLIEELAEYSGVPVWNGLTDEFHPTQVLADLLTIREHCKKPFNEINVSYIGDANNNVASSLMVACAKVGINFKAISPVECAPDEALLAKCFDLAEESGAKLGLTSNKMEGVKGADFIYTDVWVSMGEPDSVWADRIMMLKRYQVDRKLMEATGNKNVKFMHCLPAYHNDQTTISMDKRIKFGVKEMEVTDEVFESDASIVFDQAENRLHTIKAVMVATLADKI